MDPRLEALLSLQSVDVEVYRIEEQLQALPARARAAEAELARSQDLHRRLRDDLLALQKEAHQRELDLKSGEAQIAKLQTQRTAVKTNREYAALTTQIAGAETDNTRLEDQALALYVKVEQAQKAVKEQAAEVQRLTARRDALLARDREEARRLDAELADLRRRRHLASTQVPPDALALYSRLQRRLGGPPVAAVRDEVCTGCNMDVSPQTVSALRLARDLIQCTSCSRILFLDGSQP
jgi:predicted  nucleic acid-binding Zn-ribbon protein